MEKYTKINDLEVEIETTKTVVETKIMRLDLLAFDRESLVRNKAENLAEAAAKNAVIDAMIVGIDEKISKMKQAGAKTFKEIDPNKTPIEIMAEIQG